MIVVSGCPRSGTSMMMRIMKAAFGEDRILGDEFPQEKREKAIKEREAEWESKATPIQKYLRSKHKEPQGRDTERSKSMNPNGYYEMAFSVQGVFYRPNHEDLLEEILTAAVQLQPKICKIVSQGLARSDPRFIDKIVFMARDPRAVAKSQERLGRQNPMDPESAPVRDGKKVLIRSVEMFNKVTHQAARWLVRHPDIPVHIVNYDELLDDPIPVLAALEEFLGDGSFFAASEMIDHSLRRSQPEDLNGPEANHAMQLFNFMKLGEWENIRIAGEAEVSFKEEASPTSWPCPRLGQVVAVEMCRLCKSHPMTTTNLIRNAANKKIDWRNEPCPYECGIQDGVGLTVEQSIAENHWSVYTD